MDCGLPISIGAVVHPETAVTAAKICLRCISTMIQVSTTADEVLCSATGFISNCLYQTNYRCYACASGYLLATAMTSCAACATGCTACTTAASATACTACSSGYYLSGGACTACTTIHANATTCSGATAITMCTANTHYVYTYITGDKLADGSTDATVGNTTCLAVAD